MSKRALRQEARNRVPQTDIERPLIINRGELQTCIQPERWRLTLIVDMFKIVPVRYISAGLPSLHGLCVVLYSRNQAKV